MAVQRLYDDLLANLSASTVAKVHKLLGAVFKRAVFEGLVNKNIMLMVSPPRFDKQPIEIFTRDEVNKIFTVCTTHKDYSRYWPENFIGSDYRSTAW